MVLNSFSNLSRKELTQRFFSNERHRVTIQTVNVVMISPFLLIIHANCFNIEPFVSVKNIWHKRRQTEIICALQMIFNHFYNLSYNFIYQLYNLNS